MYPFSTLIIIDLEEVSMEIYTPVQHIVCMCYVSWMDMHGGYNLVFLMLQLDRTPNMCRMVGRHLELVEIPWDALYVHDNVFHQLGEEG